MYGTRAVTTGRSKSVASQAPDLHKRNNGIAPFDCPRDNLLFRSVIVVGDQEALRPFPLFIHIIGG
jgi:hypothetical protein